MLFLNLYNQNDKLWMIWRWRAAGAIKNNYSFSDSELVPAFKTGIALTDGKAKLVRGRKL